MPLQSHLTKILFLMFHLGFHCFKQNLMVIYRKIYLSRTEYYLWNPGLHQSTSLVIHTEM